MPQPKVFHYDGGIIINPRTDQVILTDKHPTLIDESIYNLLDKISEQWKGRAKIMIELTDEQ